MIITVDILKQIAPGSKKSKYKLLPDLSNWMNEWCPQFDIDTPNELRHFIAQCAHESDSFNVLKEYASGKAYENRIDIGNTAPGYGVKYKGRGLIMNTGYSNYLELGRVYGQTYKFAMNPELLERPEWAAWAACVFWSKRGLNSIANMGDEQTIPYKIKGKITQVHPIEYITRVVNGGMNGYVERVKFYERAKKAIS